MPENIDAAQELEVEVRQVTYRQIETSYINPSNTLVLRALIRYCL